MEVVTSAPCTGILHRHRNFASLGIASDPLCFAHLPLYVPLSIANLVLHVTPCALCILALHVPLCVAYLGIACHPFHLGTVHLPVHCITECCMSSCALHRLMWHAPHQPLHCASLELRGRGRHPGVHGADGWNAAAAKRHFPAELRLALGQLLASCSSPRHQGNRAGWDLITGCPTAHRCDCSQVPCIN